MVQVYNLYFKKYLLLLFNVWLILLPFDANLLPFSFGVLTIYPHLILTFCLLIFTIFEKENNAHNNKFELYGIFFFSAWIIYAAIYFPFTHDKISAKYEIRSLIMQLVYVVLIIRIKNIFGFHQLVEKTKKTFYLLFACLSGIGFAEFITGVHFAGKHTEKILQLPACNFTYTPVLFYDNPNNFITILACIVLLLMLIDRFLFKKPVVFISIISVFYFFSYTADSTIGKLAVALAIIYFLFTQVFQRKFFLKNRKNLLLVSLFAFSMIICYFSMPIFYGPFFKDGNYYLLKEIHPLRITENDSLVFNEIDSITNKFGKEKVYQSYRAFQHSEHLSSKEIRTNLNKNSIYLLITSKFLGVGPGQYSFYFNQKKVPYDTGTVTNPHNAFAEIYSQYGMLIFAGFLFLFLFLFITALRNIKENLLYSSTLILVIIIFAMIANLTSAWFNINMGWVLISFFIIAPNQFAARKIT